MYDKMEQISGNYYVPMLAESKEFKIMYLQNNINIISISQSLFNNIPLNDGNEKT